MLQGSCHAKKQQRKVLWKSNFGSKQPAYKRKARNSRKSGVSAEMLFRARSKPRSAKALARNDCVSATQHFRSNFRLVLVCLDFLVLLYQDKRTRTKHYAIAR